MVQTAPNTYVRLYIASTILLSRFSMLLPASSGLSVGFTEPIVSQLYLVELSNANQLTFHLKLSHF
jgi:hypothetical protein